MAGRKLSSRFRQAIFTKEFFDEFHFRGRMSVHAMGEEFGCDAGTICYWGKIARVNFLKSRLLVGVHRYNAGCFRPGLAPWNKGKTGYPFNRVKPGRRGKDNHNWKGGGHPRPHTIEVKEWRNAVFKRDDYTCQRCRKRGGRINAHHIKRWITHPELRFDISNGETLCVDCHWKEHHKNPRRNSHSLHP